MAREDLGIANARMQGAFLLTNQLVAPPIGAFLFAAGMALPFATNAACFALGAVLISRVVDERAERAAGAEPSFRAEMVEGIRWLVAHPPMRTLALTIFTFNVTFGAAWSVLVLYAGERLGMDAVGFGLLTTAMAIGGVIGTVSYGALERRFSLGRHHARGPADRDRHAPVARADDLAGRRACDARRLRRARVRLGHDVDGRAPARRPRRAARPGRRASTASRSSAAWSSARRSAGSCARTSGSRRRSGSASSARRCWSIVLWRQFETSSTTARFDRRDRGPSTTRPLRSDRRHSLAADRP